MINNLHLKILSIVIALMLWVGLISGEYVEVSVHAPIKLINIPKDFVAVADTNLINIVVKGPVSVTKKISYNDIEVILDVASFKVGDSMYHIDLKDVKTPHGIETVRIKPSFINITVDQFIKKSVKVTPVFIGDPKKGFVVEGVSVFPESIEIEGARSKLEQMNSIETLKANLTERNKPVTFSIGMQREEGIKTFNPPQVDVYVTFKEDLQKVSLENFPIEVRGLSEDFKAQVIGTLEVDVEGRVDLLDEKLIKEELKLYVDMSDVTKKGRYLKNIEFAGSEIYKVLKTSSSKIRIEVLNAEVLRN